MDHSYLRVPAIGAGESRPCSDTAVPAGVSG
jgi:hypothetical protein